MSNGIRSCGLALLLVAGAVRGAEPESTAQLSPEIQQARDVGARAPGQVGKSPARLKKQSDITIKGKKITDNGQSARKIHDGTSNTLMVGEPAGASKNDGSQSHPQEGHYSSESESSRSGVPAVQHNQTDMEFIHERTD